MNNVSLFALSMALGLTACAVGPNFETPNAPPGATSYMQEPQPDTTVSADIAGGASQRFLNGQDVPAQWWRSFNSEAINRMVERALMANQSLAAAQATLRQARYLLYAQAGTFLPSVDVQVSGQRAKSSSILTGTSTTTTFAYAGGFSYTLDIFGGNRRQFEAAGAQEEFQRFQMEGTYLSLIANVCLAAIDEASLRAQIAVTQDIIKSQTQELDLLNQQFQLGAVAKGDVLAQQTQLAQTEASLPPLEKQLSQVRNAMAVLLGSLPNQNPELEVTFETLALPTDIPLGVPSQLIDRRPDVRASQALFHQASAQVGVATAAMLPQFQITGNYTSSGADFGNLLTSFPSGGFWNILGSVTQPIFHGGQLWYQRRAAQAAYDSAAAQYRNAVLSGFADVANALRTLELDADALRIALEAERSARENFEITRERFRAGAISYLSMLDAERVDQQARVTLVQAQANRFADTVLLFQALGGGWWNRHDRGPTGESEAREAAAAGIAISTQPLSSEPAGPPPTPAPTPPPRPVPTTNTGPATKPTPPSTTQPQATAPPTPTQQPH